MAAQEGNPGAENGFDSGEDDDLIEIGKHKGAAMGAKSAMQDLESLTGDQIRQEDKYAHEFKLIETNKTGGSKSDVIIIKEAIEAASMITKKVKFEEKAEETKESQSTQATLEI